ncbi:MAG: ATP-dependent DNA helicase RecG, partial [Candidatus Cloacimonetes bacterium]|nr:ATP-dependent DNA helicase RecG [Candidatus Cloacimonadota bacterium]
ELFYHQLMLARCQKYYHRQERGIRFRLEKTHTTRLKQSLPFTLTGAQKRVIREIVEDMTSHRQMNRLLQGDVGSGKTIITLFAMLIAVENGYQGVLMAPTEILAEQHYRNFKKLLGNQPEIRITLLKGGNYRGKKADKQMIASGEMKIVIGTHALLQKDVAFSKVGFACIDEQHRFGVEQRAFLSRKNDNPDLLYLSATPIPRSLALTVYGDLDISILDELPPGRKPIMTVWKNSDQLEELHDDIRDQIKKGRQVYIVCPLIEESAKINLRDAETTFEEISRIFSEYRVALLHGRMNTAAKDEVMHDFKRGNIAILVSTTVIEVGIDVPNATIMVIEHAERFGLSQLHQLRGRIGRGAAESVCYLISHPPLSREARERLQTMVMTNDGFLIAEKDLELRGPGEFFGTEQSGLPAFRHANIVRDRDILHQARWQAFQIIEKDPEMASTENAILSRIYRENYQEREKLFYY